MIVWTGDVKTVVFRVPCKFSRCPCSNTPDVNKYVTNRHLQKVLTSKCTHTAFRLWPLEGMCIPVSIPSETRLGPKFKLSLYNSYKTKRSQMGNHVADMLYIYHQQQSQHCHRKYSSSVEVMFAASTQLLITEHFCSAPKHNADREGTVFARSEQQSRLNINKTFESVSYYSVLFSFHQPSQLQQYCGWCVFVSRSVLVPWTPSRKKKKKKKKLKLL